MRFLTQSAFGTFDVAVSTESIDRQGGLLVVFVLRHYSVEHYRREDGLVDVGLPGETALLWAEAISNGLA